MITPTAQRIRTLVARIPRGRVATYGQLATLAGMRGARGVGSILHQNRDPETFPCHRVVNAQGNLSPAYAMGGITAQRARLQAEGVHTQPGNPSRVDLSTYGWKPTDQLRSPS